LRIAFGFNITQPTVQIQRPGHEPKQATATFLYLHFSPITSIVRDTERNGRTYMQTDRYCGFWR